MGGDVRAVWWEIDWGRRVVPDGGRGRRGDMSGVSWGPASSVMRLAAYEIGTKKRRIKDHAMEDGGGSRSVPGIWVVGWLRVAGLGFMGGRVSSFGVPCDGGEGLA